MYKHVSKWKSSAVIITGGSLAFVGINLFEGNDKFYKSILMPCMRKTLDPEQAHLIAIKMAKWNLVPNLVKKAKDDEILSVKVFNRLFSNPIGLAAGFDKHGEAMNSLFRLGFGFIEIGSVTPLPQAGNEKPRVFRLEEDKAIINRYGFNSHGHEIVFDRIKAYKQSTKSSNPILGINLGKNKTSNDALADYTSGLRLFAHYADYIVINISSPNTPGLRSLQNRKEFETLVERVISERNKIRQDLPVIIKISPDMTDDELADIADAIQQADKRVDGLVISNTTISRPDTLKGSWKNEIGGLSGEPLKEMSNRTIEKMYKLTNGTVPIIGVGGVSNGQDALDKIKSGSTLVQIYTALTYDGPTLVNNIKAELTHLLKKEGFKNINDAVGYNIKNKCK